MFGRVGLSVAAEVGERDLDPAVGCTNSGGNNVPRCRLTSILFGDSGVLSVGGEPSSTGLCPLVTGFSGSGSSGLDKSVGSTGTSVARPLRSHSLSGWGGG
jgi:hypothetical protein